jgi:hypothetical protein
MIATTDLGEEDNLRNYSDIAMSFTFAFPPKNTKQTLKRTWRKAD